jgi:asparagine synthetase B (glutamine-hydrolysing)
MPGIAGSICLKPDLPQPADVLSRLTRSLLHEPYYSVQQIPCPEDSVAVIVNPEIDGLICGVAQDAGTGASLGFYGEFYDAQCQAAASGDDVAQILLRKYLELDDEFPRSLDGSYVIFVADGRRKRFLLFNDYCASRPVFYGIQDGRFYFSPEAKGVARMPGFDASVDVDAQIALLACSYAIADHTFYRNVKPLLPGKILTIQDGKLQRSDSKRYLPSGETNDRGEKYYLNALCDLLLQATGKLLRNADHIVLPLSGGIDSRMIAGCVHRLTGGDLRTVSWGVDDKRPGSDTVIAQTVADYLKSDHHFVRREAENLRRDIGEFLYRVDGLITDPASHSNELNIMRRIRDELGGKYVLRGEECFGHAILPGCDAEALAQWGISRLSDFLRLEGILNKERLPELRRNHDRNYDWLIETCPCLSMTDRREYYYFQVRNFHYHTRSAYGKRTVVDVRNPWMDRDLLEFLNTLPAHYRTDRYLYRKATTHMFPGLFEIPIATRNSLENWPEIVQKDRSIQQFLKAHLIDRPNSFHNILNPSAVRILYEQAIQPGGLRSSFEQRTVQATKNFLRTQTPQLYRRLKPSLMVKVKSKEIPGEELLFRMLILKIWFDQFVDGQAQPEGFYR